MIGIGWYVLINNNTPNTIDPINNNKNNVSIFLPNVLSVLVRRDKWNSNKINENNNKGVANDKMMSINKSFVYILLTVLQQSKFKQPNGLSAGSVVYSSHLYTYASLSHVVEYISHLLSLFGQFVVAVSFRYLFEHECVDKYDSDN